MSRQTFANQRIILGSRSPQRMELLRQLYPLARIEAIPPEDPDELDFENVEALDEIIHRLAKIAREKNEAVATQIDPESYDYLLTADTAIVVKESLAKHTVLGKPPSARFAETVHHWFENYYNDQSHYAMTAVTLRKQDQTIYETVSGTQVQMREHDPSLVDWYINTGEPRGKAGAYAVQGLGSLFVSGLSGSLTNVVGLPLRETQNLFEQAYHSETN